MAERCLLIVNPAAGRRTAREDDVARCVDLLAAAGFDLVTRETGLDGPDAVELAAMARDQGYPTVIVAGGDGTVAAAAIPLLDRPVTLGILPFGSWMNIARGLGLPLSPVDAARVIARRRTRRCDVGEVEGKIFFETCGVGLDADIFGAARLAERQRWGLAARRIYRWAARSPREIEVVVDEQVSRHEAVQVLIVNSPYYGWAFPIVPSADMTDGLLEVAVFPRLGRLQLLGVVLEIWLRGRPRTPPWIRRGQTVRISSSERMPVHADGQIAGRLPVTVRCRAGALRVFA